MQKPTPMLMGHPTMKLGNLFSPTKHRLREKKIGVIIPLYILKYGLIQFVTNFYRYGEFRKELGFLGNFGLGKSYTMEAPKTQYDLNKFMIWKYAWVVLYFSDTH